MAAQVDPSAIEYNDLDYEDFNRKAVNPKNIDNPQDLDDDFGMRKKGEGEFNSDLFAMEETDSGVQWTAVKPFIGALVAPTNAPPNNPTKPDEDLKLEVGCETLTLARTRSFSDHPVSPFSLRSGCTATARTIRAQTSRTRRTSSSSIRRPLSW